jgi:ADP-heptose:LPS heptosyltransferase
LQLFLQLFNQKNEGPERPIEKRCLLLRLDGKLGDTITTTGFMNALHESGYKVDIVARKSNTYIYAHVKAPHRLYSLKKGIWPLFKLIFKLRANSYDALICSTHILDPASLWLSRFAQAKTKIVFKNEQIDFFDVHISEGFYEKHVTDRFQQSLKAITGSTSVTVENYEINIPEAAFSEAKKFIGDRKKIVVLNSFAGAKLRNFSFSTSKAIIEALVKDSTVISIGNDGDLNILREWKKHLHQANWLVPHRGDFSFNAALVALSHVAITPDTAIVHLASAVNAPLVAVYREDEGEEKNSKIWAPLYSAPQDNKKGHKIIYAPLPDINNVDTHEVVKAAKELLTFLP